MCQEAAEEDNEEDDNVVLSAYPRPHAQPAGTSTAGSFTMSNKRKPRTLPPLKKHLPCCFCNMQTVRALAMQFVV